MSNTKLPPGWEYASELFGKGRVYVAGPMTGVPQFNFPAFDAAAKSLRSMGFDVVTPSEMDDPETRATALASPDGAPGSGSANGETWGDFLARDVKFLADGGIEGVVVLDGWHTSRGARLETFIAAAILGLPVVDEAGRPLGPQALLRAWGGPLYHAFMDSLAARIKGSLVAYLS